MKIIRKEFHKISRSDEFTILPIGDIHIGSAACDEKLLQAVVNRVKNEPNTYWIGMGDYADFINISDKRFDLGTLAEWIGRAELLDLAKAQRDRFLDITKPIAHKCLALLRGNHEDTILKKYERDIYLEIVTEIKTAGGMKAEDNLALDYYGWLRMVFYRHNGNEAAITINGNLHHGFTNGKLAGAKALNMQRWLWTHDCDFALFGHSHNTMAQVETVETLDRGDNVVYQTRHGGYSGTFMMTTMPGMPSGYAERKGFFPMPLGGCEVWLKPGAKDVNERVRILT